MNNESELEAVWWRRKGQREEGAKVRAKSEEKVRAKREEKVRAKSEEQEYLEETLTGHSRTATV